ncbi:MAG TPA: oxidoreductase [Chitinophagaceae bacterium]
MQLKKHRWSVIILLSLFSFTGFRDKEKPEVLILTSGTNTSLRGLSVVNDNIIWASGSNGVVGKSTNAGKNWNWITVQGYEKTEFRDIEAFDANTAIIMAIAEPAYILKTTDGGSTWKMVYENKAKGMFLDAMDFSTPLHGLVVGDPINNKPFIAETLDGGNTWKEKLFSGPHVKTDSGEAFFAASGSNIRLFENGEFFLVSGGNRSRFITKTTATTLPFPKGIETAGANSIDIFDDGIPNKPGKNMIVVGGDFKNMDERKHTCFYSSNSGKSWQAASKPPNGYRSCVEYLSKTEILACGMNGVDYSDSKGKTWEPVSKEGFHVCRIARTGSAVYLAGEGGKIGKLVWKY